MENTTTNRQLLNRLQALCEGTPYELRLRERENSIGVEYWRQLCAMFGIGKFDYVFAGGLDTDPALAPERLEAACALARRLAEKF